MLRWRFNRDLALGLGILCLSGLMLSSFPATAIDGDVEVEVGILPMLTITTPTRVRIVLEPGGPATIAEMPVYIATNNQSGLHAAVSVDKVSDGEHDTFLRSLVNEYDSNYLLEPLEESIVDMADFPFDHWGCTFAEDMRYEGLNTSDKPAIRYLTHNPSANEKRSFLCAARASKFQVAGLYSNTIMMTAVPNVLPDTITSITYMQEINETVIASMETDQSYQLVDGRDKKIYWVTKLRDGRVWMTQNLDYDLEAKTDRSELAELGSLYPTNSEASVVATAHRYYKDGGNYYYDTDTDTYGDSSTLSFNNEKRHYQIGSFYNIETSSREDEGDVVYYADASGLCPFSWTVPDAASSNAVYGPDITGNLLSLYGNDAASSLYLAPMGYLNASGVLSGVGSGAYFLSNTRVKTGLLAANSDAYDFRGTVSVNGSYAVSKMDLSDVYSGFIRCVAIPGRRYAIEFKNTNHNVDLGNGSTTEFEQATMPESIESLTYETKYSFNTNNKVPGNIPDGYTFLGWTTDENNRAVATITGVANLGNIQEVITASDQGNSEVNLTLFPAWEHNYTEAVLPVEGDDSETRSLDDITYMQEINPSIVSNTPYNEIKQLIDNRDNKRYWVRKLGDGNLWMEQNLDLSFDEPRTLTPEDTNISSTKTLSNSDDGITQQHISGGYNDVSKTAITDNDLALLTDDSENWRYVYGSNYNRAALHAGADDAFKVNGDYSESICPKGWELPSATGTSNVFYRDNVYENAQYHFAGNQLATATPVNSSSFSDAAEGGSLVAIPTKKISYTQNLDESGRQLSYYSNNWSNYNIRGSDRSEGSSQAHVITVSGAAELHIEIFHNGEGCCDYVTVHRGAHPEFTYDSYTYDQDYSNGYVFRTSMNSYSTSYTINGNTINNVGRDEVIVPGDTATLTFRSDSSVNGEGYGYYAIITGYKRNNVIPDGSLLTFTSFNNSNSNYYSQTFAARCVASGREKVTTKTLRNISTMQEMKPEICAATPVGTEVQLGDTRDGQTYFVRKMSDNHCWMVQNLALGKTRLSNLDALSSDLLDKNASSFSSNASADNPGHMSAALARSDDVVTIEYGYPFANIDNIPMNSYFRKFYSGMFYNYSSVSLDANGVSSACPRGWRLPTAADGLIPDENFSREELSQVYSAGERVDYANGPIYLTSTSDEENQTITLSDGSVVGYDDANFYPVRCLAR